MNKILALAATTAVALTALTPIVEAKDLRLSSSLPQVHMWVYGYMDPFADKVEAATDGEITFTRFYSGELLPIGREYGGLAGGTVDVAAPLVAAQNEGRFPLSEITQLPAYGTTSVMMTDAFQKLLDSDEKLSNGQTYYEYEIGSKDIEAWPVATTGPYAISTTGTELREPDDFKGVPMRAGSVLHTILLDGLGATPVTMPGSQSYEALSRKTIDGIILSIGDWKGYSLTDLLRYTIDGVAAGHFSSYNAVNDKAWNELTPDQQKIWDQAARETATENAQLIDRLDAEVKAQAVAAGVKFVELADLSSEMQAHIAKAGSNTWHEWVEKNEAAGHPARSAARLWAQLLLDEGAKIPEGVASDLDL